MIMLRSLAHAEYNSRNIGHFGLSLDAYAHFTSPIRRYPDLLVHRAIRHISRGSKVGSYGYDSSDMKRLGAISSAHERRAEDATREVEASLKCQFMLDKIGENYDGHITGVTNFGIFVQLPDLQIDGLIHVTRDGGESWTDVTANVPGMPDWGSIRNIEASRYDAGTAYFAVDGHQANNRDPWLYRTHDYGESWTLIVNGIEKSPLSYTRSILEDPVRPGLLYAGTENGLFVSFNDGDMWQPLQSNLPHAPALWLVIQEHFNVYR